MTNEGIVGNANELRRAVVTRRRLRAQGWWVSLLVVAVGVVLAVDGSWAPAVPVLLIGVASLWLVGAWVVPRTKDAYVRRVARAWSAWAADTQLAYGRFANRQAKFPDCLAELSPPPELRAEHERLVSFAREHDRLRIQPRTPNFAREVTAAHKAVREAKEKLAHYAATDEQRAYVVALDRLFSERSDDYATASAASERATADAVTRLSRITAPDSVAAEHQALIAAIRAHLDVARAFHEASQAADPDHAAEAAARWETSVTSARDAFHRVAERLDFYERWPRPDDATTHDGSQA